MEKLFRRLGGSLGLNVGREASTLLISKPEPGPPTFRCGGIDWNEPRIDAVLNGPLVDYRAEFDAFPRKAEPDSRGYSTGNPFFGYADGAVAYALLRERRPSVVVE